MRPRNHTRLMLLATVVLIALGAVTACGAGKQSADRSSPIAAPTPAPVAALPQTGTFIANMSAPGDKAPITMALSVDGEKVVGYACDGKSEEAWFFGKQTNGGIDMMSRYQDHVHADYDGTKLTTNLLINDVEYTGSALLGDVLAGIYTATYAGARSTWLVGSDHSIIGVLLPNAKQDLDVINEINAHPQAPEYAQKVRQARQARVGQPAPPLTYGTWASDINGTPVTAVHVTANMTSPPSTG